MGEREGDPWELMEISELRLYSLCVHVPYLTLQQAVFPPHLSLHLPLYAWNTGLPFAFADLGSGQGRRGIWKGTQKQAGSQLSMAPPTWGSPRSEQGDCLSSFFWGGEASVSCTCAGRGFDKRHCPFNKKLSDLVYCQC